MSLLKTFKYYKKFVIIFLININIIIIIKDKENNNKIPIVQKKTNFIKKKFAFVRRLDCPICGFFSFYIVHLGCLNKYLSEGYIPIIDLQSFNNIYNKNNISYNPWELFFYQPFNYTLYEVKKYAKNITYLNCTSKIYKPNENIYFNKPTITFWHQFAKKYMPVKDNIIYETKTIMKKLFNKSKNILGVKLRGTDYIALRPKFHPIPPKVEQVITDVKLMDTQYKYDYIFFSTEDEIIKGKFQPEFKEKLKLLNTNIYVKYNYNERSYITLNKNIIGNIEHYKNYLLNILILSKCLDFICSRGSGSIGVFILTNGFRNIKVYDLGFYT